MVACSSANMRAVLPKPLSVHSLYGRGAVEGGGLVRGDGGARPR